MKFIQESVIKTVLSLCDYSGVWSQPYRDAGYNVIQVDLQHGQDLRLLEYPGHMYGVLAAPPCTVFCRAGATYWHLWGDDKIIDGIALVDACLRFVAMCQPRFWALENPPGRLHRFLGPPQYSFQPWEFGDPWTKQTYLWGKFNKPKKKPVKPTIKNRTNGFSSSARNARSETPVGFAKAFFEANK